MSIISLSGKANSGKDLIAKIIQGLTINPSADVEYIEKFYVNSKFVNKKWADKLKDIICLLTGCTRAQLEDRDFKESELGEEWRKWQCFTSDSCWKSTKEKAISDAKEHYRFVYHDQDKYELSYEELVEKSVISKTYTPRMLLQEIGTDLFRNQLHPQIWVNALMSDYIPKELDKVGSLFYPDWIISDTRFPNELQAVKDRGGLTIKVERDIPCSVCGLTKSERRGKNCFEITCPNGRPEHISETALDSAEFDEVIINDGSIEELIEKVKVILIKYKII